MKNKPSSTLSPDWRSYVRWSIKVDSWPHKAQCYITVKSSIYILSHWIAGDMVEIKKRGEMHPWVSSLLRGWGCERGKGARKASNSWGGGRVSFVLPKHCFQPQDEKGDGQLHRYLNSVTTSYISQPLCSTAFYSTFHEASEWYHNHLISITKATTQTFLLSLFPQCVPTLR